MIILRKLCASKRARRTMFWLAFSMFGPAAMAADLPKADAVFPEPDMIEVKLGQLLFYDPILSGNKTVSCATCHHPRFATSDGLSLGLGDGGIGLGPDRRADPDNMPEQRIPRNAPALFNLGATEFTVFFHDGRLEEDPNRPAGIRTPLGADMEMGFDNALSAQTMFPVLSPDEMAGHYSENDVSQAVRQGRLTGDGGAWDILSKRVEDLPRYRAGFDLVIGEREIEFTDISNAIAAFMAFEWRADNSRFDQYLRMGQGLSPLEEAGMELFYGAAGCSDCHSGQFQTDHGFHALAMPQIGPGKAARFESHARDTGRIRVTGKAEDAYRFRTPSLRNVTQTGPYGHAGAYKDLGAVIRHHWDPAGHWLGYAIQGAVLPELPVDDLRVMSDTQEMLATLAQAQPVSPVLDSGQMEAIVAFLGSLEDQTALDGRLGIPDQVPSGLPVDQ